MTAHGWLLGVGASAALHAGFWLAAPTPEPPMVSPTPTFVIEIPVEVEPPPPPPPVEPPPDEPKQIAPEPIARAPRPTAAPSLPDAARAGRTLVAEPTATPSPEIADFTLVQGTGDSFAGGTTTARGTADRAVRGAVNDGSPRIAGSAAPAVVAAAQSPAVDLSKPASPAGGDWSCSSLFPSDPDAPDRAAVTLVVDVDASGHAKTIHVTADPGHGFGDAARRCARGQTFTPAKGPDGAGVPGKTRPFVVRFSR